MIRQNMVRIAIIAALLLGGFFPITASANTGNTDIRTVDCSTYEPVLLFPVWYQGLKCETVTTTVREGTDGKGKVISTNKSENVKIDSITDVWVIVMNIVQWLIIAGGYVSLYFIIWGGFKYITSAGDPQKVEGAKNAITNAVIGLIIVLVSVAIVRTVQAAILRGVAQ